MSAPTSFRRPAGITVAAVLLGVFSGLLVLGAAASALAGVALSSLTARTAQPGMPVPPLHAMAILFGVGILFHLLLAGWGIATLVGLVRLRSWARISAIVIGVALAGVGALAFAASLMARHMVATQPYAGDARSASFVSGLILVYSLLWLCVVAVGVWFVVYFLAQRIREVFRAGSALAPVPIPGDVSSYATERLDETHFMYAEPLPARPSVAAPAAMPHPPLRVPSPEHVPAISATVREGVKRPVSITAIAILLFAGTASLLLCLLLPFPMFFFGVVCSGATARSLLLAWAVLSGIAGFGLLRLHRLAWWGAAGLYAVGLINLALLAVPAYRLRALNYSTGLNARMTQWFPQPPPSASANQLVNNTQMAELSLLCGMVVGILFTAFVLILLWRARWAFQPGATTPANLPTTSSV